MPFVYAIVCSIRDICSENVGGRGVGEDCCRIIAVYKSKAKADIEAEGMNKRANEGGYGGNAVASGGAVFKVVATPMIRLKNSPKTTVVQN